MFEEETNIIRVDPKSPFSIFRDERFGKVRCFIRDGEVYFVGKDIATALGYSDTDQAIRKNCKRQEIFGIPSSGRGVQKTIIIPESDVYRLAARSKLEESEKFKDWLFEEVLPTLRRDGAYSLESKPIHTADHLDVLNKALDVMTQLAARVLESKPSGEEEEEASKKFSIVDYESVCRALAHPKSKVELVAAFLGDSDLSDYLQYGRTKAQYELVVERVRACLFFARGQDANPGLLKSRHNQTLRAWAREIVDAAYDSTRSRNF